MSGALGCSRGAASPAERGPGGLAEVFHMWQDGETEVDGLGQCDLMELAESVGAVTELPCKLLTCRSRLVSCGVPYRKHKRPWPCAGVKSCGVSGWEWVGSRRAREDLCWWLAGGHACVQEAFHWEAPGLHWFGP